MTLQALSDADQRALIVLATIAIALAACRGEDPTPIPSPSTTSTGDELEAPAEGETDVDELIVVCDFVPSEVPVGGVTCPDGCVMIKGAPIDFERGCSLTGFRHEVALACLRLPVDVQTGSECYRDANDHYVVTSLTYPGLAHTAWETCPADLPHRNATPCATFVVPRAALESNETLAPGNDDDSE